MDLEGMVKNVQRTMVLGDIHIPYQDDNAVNTALKYAKEYKPHNVVVNADLVDFYGLSDFDKNPERKGSIQDELDEANKFLRNLRKAVGDKTKIYLTYGNHEARLQRYLWRNPELESLRDLKLEKQLALKELNIKFINGSLDYWKQSNGHLKIGDAAIMHGDQRINGSRGGAKSGYAAMNTMLQMQSSVVMGHVHRLGIVYHNSPYDQLVGVEGGCLCTIPPGANWQQGFVTFDTVKNKNVNYRLHHIKGGKLYE